MQSDNLIKGIVGAALGLLLFVSFAMPVIVDAQTDIGDSITKTNSTAAVYCEVESGDVLECTSTYADSTRSNVWTFNGETVTSVSGLSYDWDTVVFSDGLYLGVYAPANVSIGNYYDMDDSTATTRYVTASSSSETSVTLTVTFGDSEITMVRTVGDTSTTLGTYEYTWAYSMCPYDEGEYCAAVSGGSGYVSNADEVMLCGAYKSGELDTTYYYKDGVNYTGTTDYTMTTNINTSLASGTTDIYTATVSVDITDGTDTENFTPYRIFLPYEVTGHATSGTLYSMVGLLPLLLVVSLVLGVIGLAVRARLS